MTSAFAASRVALCLNFVLKRKYLHRRGIGKWVLSNYGAGKDNEHDACAEVAIAPTSVDDDICS